MTATISPGVYPLMPREEYDQLPALNNSCMKDLAVSPLRCWYYWLNPEPQPSEEESETAALRLGKAMHVAVFEPGKFDKTYARALDPLDWPVCLETIGDIRAWITANWNPAWGKEPKGATKAEVIQHALKLMDQRGVQVPILDEEKRRHEEANAGRIILSADEWERVNGMAVALLTEPKLAKILEDGSPEATLVAPDPETGVLLKARLDWLNPRCTVDAKSFTQARGKTIDKSIHDAIFYEGYYRQAYFYSYVRSLALGEKPNDSDFINAFVESDQPHETRLKRMRPKRGSEPNLYWLTAAGEVRSLIRKFADCLNKYGNKPWRDDCEIETLTDDDLRQFSFI